MQLAAPRRVDGNVPLTDQCVAFLLAFGSQLGFLCIAALLVPMMLGLQALWSYAGHLDRR